MSEWAVGSGPSARCARWSSPLTSRRPADLRWAGAVAVVAAAWLIAAPATADLAAHAYRAWLWDAEGFTVWNAQWYGGHHVPGYSLVFPPLASALGARPAVALAGVAAAAALAALARDAAPDERRASVSAGLLAAGAAANLVIGRGPFTLGIAFGALALLLARRERLAGAAAASLACVWSSPVAGLFLVVCAAAWAIPRPRREVAVAVPAIAGGLALALLFPEGGEERFVATAFWPMLALSVATLALIAPEHRGLRAAAALYLVLLVAAFALPTPMGQNAVRLGALAGPAVLVLAGRGPRATLLVTGAALVYLQWLPAVRAVVEAHGDPATEAAYHQPLIDFLGRAAAPGDRVEIPLTRNHWEAAHVAPHIALARGWERQLDLKVNALFYDERPLTAERYHDWLRREQIRWVALPDAPLDFSARAEANLIETAPDYLRQRLATPHWRVFEVRDVPASPILDAGPDTLTVRGSATLRRRYTRYWRIVAGRGCVRRAPGGWIAVSGRVRLKASLHGDRCH